MPRKDTILSVFVSSPNDVPTERELLSRIIDELNSIHAKRQGVRLELIMWEREVSPDMGEDAQAVINEQISKEYDVFICIIWNRIGTATKRAESGTVEEFELVKARHDKDPSSVRPMLYFKNAPPLSMKDFDPDQYKGAQIFRERVKEAGVLYREFTESESFANHVRFDLTKLMLDRIEQESDDGQIKNDSNTCVIKSDNDLDDEGIIDLEELFEEELDNLQAVLERMREAIKQVGNNTTKRTLEIRSLDIPKDTSGLNVHEKQKLRAAAKRIFKQTANDMNVFVSQMKEELPLFRKYLGKSIEVFTKAVPIYIEINEDRDDSDVLKMSVTGMRDAMVEMVAGMEGLQKTVHGIPKVSTVLIRSAREAGKVLQEVIDITRGGITSLEQVSSIIA